MFRFEYVVDAPIIGADRLAQLGGNINGPSLIRCPPWIAPAPASYLLYFAHHEGRSIRLALSDRLEGPWRLHQPPPMRLEDSLFALEAPALEHLDPAARTAMESGADGGYPHVASPEAWIDTARRRIRLYYHGRMRNGLQATRVALSRDGLEFTALEELLASTYLRIFRQDDWYYALGMPAQLYRSRDGLGEFEAGPRLTDEPIRHHALLHYRGQWYLFWTRVGDSPERILVSSLRTGGDWLRWRIRETAELHRAERDWEGASLPATASSYGAIMQPVNQLRDPAIFEEGGRIFLLYAIAGEQGIAIGELSKI